MVYLQNVTQEGQRLRSRKEAAPGGGVAPESQEAYEDSEEQDGSKPHGPRSACLPSCSPS